MTVYEADWICPATSEPIQDGAIAVESGRITGVGPAKEIAGTRRVQHAGCAIIPGFVNAHTHLELTILRGLLENIPFLQWIQRLTQIKYQILTRDDLKLSAQLGAIEMLRAGVTTVAEVMDVGTGWEAMLEFGLQGIAYQEVFGPDESVVAESMKGLVGKVDRYRCDESAANCTDIAGATSRTYTVDPTDVNFALRVEATAANRFGSAVAKSTLTASVTPPPDPGVQ